MKLFGEEIEVQAHICSLSGISAHADNEGLLEWVRAFEKKPEKVFVVHGEDTVCELFAGRLRSELGIDAAAPYSGTVYDLAENVCIVQGQPVKAKKTEALTRLPKAARGSTVFARLWAAGQRLLTVIRHNEGGANKDLAKFADQINALCEKWDR